VITLLLPTSLAQLLRPSAHRQKGKKKKGDPSLEPVGIVDKRPIT
jgi:hypothetical protein